MRNAMTLVGPYCQPLHVQSSPDSSRLLTMLTIPDGGRHNERTKAENGGGHSERTKAENDGEASDGNEQQPWKMRQCSGRWRGVRGQHHATQAYKWYKKPKD